MSLVEIRSPDPAGDAEWIYALIERHRGTLSQWLSGIVKPQSAADTEAFLRLQAEGNHEGRCAHRVILADGEIAGICSLHGISAAHRYARLGYWLADSHVGRGVMSQALTLLLNYAFEDLELHRVELGCAPENLRSCRVAERLGFKLEGELRDAQFLRGRFWNMRCYGLLADEWKNRT
ncbi:GNAT family N-acetyltransferase [Chromobacterium piscinae]|uniref:GNAT family protein n=2 Tax=Chromobacterium piscinae TaxID=686831 RepID=A0ABV0HAQ6_9NEIS|nr:GNAT family protein [Chromobacterium piscinae]MBX9348593.1 GNAT family N-acetyltransferase [Chromobacterium vaccinii]MCD4504877.1 GNAT family N-acetyltransferase [Chromobacterium piscinae]MCD5327729.1 GNAT family N-acetyltransferase [Chromobacterium piscinae]NHQ81227.1 GNAT family N-acetyltransferase [Chromobacterium vaccinii]